MKTEVLRGRNLTHYSLGDDGSRRAEAPQFQNHEKIWQSQIELSHEKTENHKAWLPVHSVGSWTLQSHLHITCHRQAMDCYHKWHASHWRYKELRRSKGQRLELSQKSMQVMEAVSIIIVGLMTAMWLFIIVGLVCCHVHQLQERKRLRRTHASYFKQ